MDRLVAQRIDCASKTVEAVVDIARAVAESTSLRVVVRREISIGRVDRFDQVPVQVVVKGRALAEESAADVE